MNIYVKRLRIEVERLEGENATLKAQVAKLEKALEDAMKPAKPEKPAKKDSKKSK